MASLREKVEAELEQMDQGTRGRGSISKGECPRERWTPLIEVTGFVHL